MSYNLFTNNLLKRSFWVSALILSTVLFVGSVSAQDTNYKENLTSDSEEVALEAIKTAGDKKDAETLDTLIDILKNNPNSRIRIEAARSIGKMEVKDIPINALSESVQTDQDDAVVYASLLAMTNLGGVEKDIQELPAVLDALQYCRENKSNDLFIHDLVTKYDDITSKSKAKKAKEEVEETSEEVESELN